MRIGGVIMKMYNSPSQWLSYVKELTYSSVSFPVNSDAPKSVIHDYLSCIRDNDLVIGEVGIWKNCFSSDEDVRKNAYDWSVRQLALAEEVGANCCVNISGAFGSVWDGYYCENLTEKAYEKVVSLAQKIIDEVKPVKTSFTLEPMPWMYPDSPETYLKLIKDIDRDAFKVHLDYANMINGVQRYHDSASFIDHCFDLLKDYIVSIHAKDLYMSKSHLPVMISEVLPGEGEIDLGRVLKRAHALGDDIPVFVEHLASHEEYVKAINHMRKTAAENGVHVK